MITSYKLPKETQREIERIVSKTRKPIAGASKVEKVQYTANTAAKSDNRKILSQGIVLVNQLPLDPTTMPPNSPSSEFYRYANYTYDPSHGKYGWYCYGIINHNLQLSDDERYIIEFLDLDEIDDQGTTVALNFSSKRCYPQYEPLNRNRIIVHGIYKPGIVRQYNGSPFTQELAWLNEDKRKILTNMIYHYTILGE